ncbi:MULTISPECIES: hypothetical protein [Micromonospora]|uniref:hypothetical protein n=1 Tax=Micromonospora TaxID=1873 RepID=UPI0013753899|nr:MULTISPECIES: hypothetical protein [Micromonospora]MBM0229959.1 hypothetical protein [Micromonospora sp. ATA51]
MDEPSHSVRPESLDLRSAGREIDSQSVVRRVVGQQLQPEREFLADAALSS